jgi:hypothetical protein
MNGSRFPWSDDRLTSNTVTPHIETQLARESLIGGRSSSRLTYDGYRNEPRFPHNDIPLKKAFPPESSLGAEVEHLLG